MEMTRVLYNGRCPICRAEMLHYAHRAEALGAPLTFEDLHASTLDEWHLTPDQVTRRLHARLPDGTQVSGISAFAAIWDHLPKMRWMARAVRMPVVGPLARIIYDRIAAPTLYRMHLRRESRNERLGNPPPPP